MTDDKPNGIDLSRNPFSQEVPQLPQRHQDDLRASAISPDVIRGRDYSSALGRKLAEKRHGSPGARGG